METILQNLRYAWRQLRHSPEVTILAVATLGLGIGANTAMFTAVESVLLRPLPYADSERLVHVVASGGESAGSLSWLDYLDIRNHSHALAAVGAYSNDIGVVQNKDSSLSVVTSEVTPNVFKILGSQPLKGRTFTENEGEANGPPAVVISEGLWRSALGADPAIVGYHLRVNGHDRTIVGVMPKSFRFPESAGKDIEAGLWLPMQPTSEMLQDRGADFFMILAKRASGPNLSRLEAELDLIAKNVRDTDSRADRKLAFRAQSYRETVTGSVREVFLALVAALGLVLLIVCANVANLLIARCLGRQHEFAVRAALGSGQGRLIGQLLVEAGLLSVLGCALGLLLAYWITAAIHSLPAGIVPRAESIEVRWTVTLVLGAIATLTTLLSAVLPALFIARTEAQTALRAGSRSLGASSFSTWIGGWLVGGEVALSAVLLIAAGLLFRTLWSIEHTRLGFDTTNVTSFVAMPADAAGFGNITVSAASDPRVSVATTVYQPLLEALRHTPGFQDAALATAPPFSGFELQTNFRIVGRLNERQSGLAAKLTAVSGRFEEVMGTPVARGRSITGQDTANASFIAVINETFAKKYFVGEDALGQQLDLGGRATGMLKPYTIVGVIGDQVDASAAQPRQPLLMLPYRQIPPTSLYYPALLKTAVHFVVKTRGSVTAAPAARTIFRRIAPDLALDKFQTMQEAVDRSNFGSRLGLYLIGAFGGLAVLLVVAGLYGVLSQIVNQRRREFGLRLALGASRQSIVRMLLLKGSAIVAMGLGAGVVLALSVCRLIAAYLYGVKPVDAGAYAFAIIALFLVGAGAALLPGWRAASLEPVKALRDE
jgi:putative ABC transport system permease protein